MSGNRASTRIVRYMEWVCSCESFKKSSEKGMQRQPRLETRFGCKACFRDAHDPEIQYYKVTKFITEHTHETGCNLKENRYLVLPDKLNLVEMTDVSIRTCKALDYLEHIKGGSGKLSFNRKDAYNYLDKRYRDMIRDGDVNTAISLLDGIQISYSFVYKFNINVDGALTSLFWCDSMSKKEFESLGDVLCMDSMYKTNTYHFPLILFIGVDNHYTLVCLVLLCCITKQYRHTDGCDLFKSPWVIKDQILF